MLTRRMILTLAVVPTAAGCYTAVPVDLDAAPPPAGARVEVALTSRGTDELARLLGPGVARVDGDLARVGGDSLVLSLVRTERAGGIDDLWQRQRVAVARPLVASTARRRLSRARTFLLGGAALLGALALGTGFLGDRIPFFGTGSGTEPPN